MSILHLLTQHNMLVAVFSYLFLRSVITSIVFMTNETDLCIVNVFIIFVLLSIIVYQNGNAFVVVTYSTNDLEYLEVFLLPAKRTETLQSRFPFSGV